MSILLHLPPVVAELPHVFVPCSRTTCLFPALRVQVKGSTAPSSNAQIRDQQEMQFAKGPCARTGLQHLMLCKGAQYSKFLTEMLCGSKPSCALAFLPRQFVNDHYTVGLHMLRNPFSNVLFYNLLKNVPGARCSHCTSYVKALNQTFKEALKINMTKNTIF
ncbi:hypothetical protein XELAEV_18017428mg [Xenopus laevis]|uniref:Uncharacterized protein n=1 Tax=Xenopus laevis TaxID=8355 RepID=A0A974HSE6_XENLA|nr:hypothetical protein XELAEV_18017428mg [Xenopus laevis]